MPDVAYARTLADHLEKEIPLELEVCHTLDKVVDCKDFVFSSGGGWLDPGAEIWWKTDLQSALPSPIK